MLYIYICIYIYEPSLSCPNLHSSFDWDQHLYLPEVRKCVSAYTSPKYSNVVQKLTKLRYHFSSHKALHPQQVCGHWNFPLVQPKRSNLNLNNVLGIIIKIFFLQNTSAHTNTNIHERQSSHKQCENRYFLPFSLGRFHWFDEFN